MKFNRVFINPGHGGMDSGAVGSVLGLREADVNMELAYLLYEERPWHNVLLSRWNGTGALWKKKYESEALERICRDANDWGADLFVSLHCNSVDSPSVRGWSIWTSRGNTTSDKVATAIFNSVKASFPTMKMLSDFSDNDPDYEAGFYVLNHTNMPAVLIENLFLSNPDDERLLATPTFLKQMADAIYAGIVSYT